jgi:hypothetical protein
VDDIPYLRLNGLQLVDEEADEDGENRWRVSFDAATDAMEYAELSVIVFAEGPEVALRKGRTEMEKALRELKRAADAWKK